MLFFTSDKNKKKSYIYYIYRLNLYAGKELSLHIIKLSAFIFFQIILFLKDIAKFYSNKNMYKYIMDFIGYK